MKKNHFPDKQTICPITESNNEKSNIALTQYQGEPRVDSRLLSKQLGTLHKSTIELIDRYAENIHRFGQLPFKTEVGNRTQGGGKAQRFALLNEDQAFFLLSLSRNTNRVVNLKSDLIMAFREARYGQACQTLNARHKDASNCARRLAYWRHEKSELHQHITYLKEQLKLPLYVEGRDQ